MSGVAPKRETSGWLSSGKLVAPKGDNIHNPYIVSSGTIFYKKKGHISNAQKRAEKSLSKQERKSLQRKRQEELILHPKQLTLHKVNIIRLLDNYTENEIARGLHLAATSIDKDFSSLSYFIPYIKRAN